MGVRAADHSEPKGIGTETVVGFQPEFERGASVLVGQHPVFLGLGALAHRKVARVPGFVVGEAVVRRQCRMGLAVPLDLGDLVDRLPATPAFGVGPCNWLAIEVPQREHQPVTQIAVVGNRQNLATGFPLVTGHKSPEVFRILAVHRGKRPQTRRFIRTVPVDHVAVQIAVFVSGTPLVSDKRRKFPRLVEGVGRLRHLLPDALPGGLRGGVRLLADHHALELPEHGGNIPFIVVAPPPLPQLCGEKNPIAVRRRGEGSEKLRVVRHHQKIQRIA